MKGNICRMVFLFCAAAMVGSLTANAGNLDPRLLALTQSHSVQAQRSAQPRAAAKHYEAVPPSPFQPRQDADGRVQVYVLPRSPSAPLPSPSALTALGAVQVQVSKSLNLVQTWISVSELRALAALPEVGRVTLPAYAIVHHPFGRVSPAAMIRGTALPQGVTAGLKIDDAAVNAMQANELNNVNANGTGIKVGVISDDNSGLSASQAAGYLPATVWADPTYPGTTPNLMDPAEGTAMLEEVHAMAPGASLGFCGPPLGDTQAFTSCYNDLLSWGAHVIVDDLPFVTDAFSIGSTNDGSFTYHVNQITTQHPNVAFLSAAGNDAQDYLEAQWTPGPACTEGGVSYASCMDFGKALGESSANAIKVTLNLTMDATSETFTPDMEWNDPASFAANPASAPDQFVLFLVNASGAILAQSQQTIATTDGRPYITLSFPYTTTDTVTYLEVACVSCVDPVTLKIMGNSDDLDQFSSISGGSLAGGQQVASGDLATVAAGVSTPSLLGINLEPFSAIGPFLYGDFGATSTLAKPDLTGVDGATVSGAGGFSASGALTTGGVPFCGTSATSPNVGALIADLMSADPGQPASFYYQALKSTANQTVFGQTPSTACNANPNPLVIGYTAASAGAGLAQGYAALESFFTFPSTSITAPVAVADGATGNYTAATGATVTLTAAVVAGTNPVSAANCQWTANSGTPSAATAVGASSAWTLTATGSYTFSVECPDSRGIIAPNAPVLDVTAMNMTPPTATIAGVTPTGFGVTLTGTKPLTVTATSSNTNALTDAEITVSPGCGVTTLTCSVTLSPGPEANGDTIITVTVKDQFSQTGTATATETYTPAPPTVKISGAGSSGFAVALTGLEPLTVTATSSESSIIPNSGIAVSSGCGSSTLNCIVSLTPDIHANGNTTITVSATDSLGQKGSASTTEQYTYTAPPPAKGGGGGAMGWLTIVPLASLIGWRRRTSKKWVRNTILVAATSIVILGVDLAKAGTLDSRLAALINRPTPAATAITEAARNPFAPRVDSEGRVQVYILPVSPGAPLSDAAELHALGVVSIKPSTALNLIEAWVPIAKLKQVAALQDVGRVTIPAYALPKRPINTSVTTRQRKGGGGDGIFMGLMLGCLVSLRCLRRPDIQMG